LKGKDLIVTTGDWKEIGTTFPGELEDYDKLKSVTCEGDWVRYVQKEDWVRLFRWVIRWHKD